MILYIYIYLALRRNLELGGTGTSYKFKPFGKFHAISGLFVVD